MIFFYFLLGKCVTDAYGLKVIVYPLVPTFTPNTGNSDLGIKLDLDLDLKEFISK